MKWLLRIALGLLVLLLIALGILEARQSSLRAKGETAPSFALQRLGGGTISSDALRGRVVMVDFWATWCGPCVEEMPHLARLAKEYEGRGLSFVAVNQDDPEARVPVSLFADKIPGLSQYVAFSDEETARAFKVQALPTLYFLGRKGEILEARRGAVSEGWLRKRIEQFLSEPPPP